MIVFPFKGWLYLRRRYFWRRWLRWVLVADGGWNTLCNITKSLCISYPSRIQPSPIRNSPYCCSGSSGSWTRWRIVLISLHAFMEFEGTVNNSCFFPPHLCILGNACKKHLGDAVVVVRGVVLILKVDKWFVEMIDSKTNCQPRKGFVVDRCCH